MHFSAIAQRQGLACAFSLPNPPIPPDIYVLVAFYVLDYEGARYVFEYGLACDSM